VTPALLEAFPPPLRQCVEEETLRDQLGGPDDIAEAMCVSGQPDAARNVTGQVLVERWRLFQPCAGDCRVSRVF
jgi:hypothetical protein